VRAGRQGADATWRPWIWSVFPEYSLHGLSMDTNPEIMCRLDGPEVERLRGACIANDIWGCFSIMEFNPSAIPSTPA
jgi:formamidase